MRNLLVSPKEQTMFGLRVLMAPLMVVTVLSLSFLPPIISQSEALAPWVDPGHRMALDVASSQQAYYLSGTYLLSAVYLFTYVVVVSHRIFGPMISIRKYVNGLIAGKPQGDLVLRKGDYFHDLAALLTELNRKRGVAAASGSNAS